MRRIYVIRVMCWNYLIDLIAHSRNGIRNSGGLVQKKGARVPRAPLGSRGAEYYALSPMEKAEILTHLCDEVLDTRAAKEVINARQDDEMNVFGEDRDDETEPEPGGASGGGDDDDESRGIVDLGVDVVSVVGARVEVFGDEAEGLDGSWYGAEVIASRAARGKGGLASVKVRYDELLADEEEEDDDDARRLEEWIDLETMRCEDSARPLKSWHGRRYLPRAPRVRPRRAPCYSAAQLRLPRGDLVRLRRRVVRDGARRPSHDVQHDVQGEGT